MNFWVPYKAHSLLMEGPCDCAVWNPFVNNSTWRRGPFYVPYTVFSYRNSGLGYLTGTFGFHYVHIFLYCDVLHRSTARLRGPTKRMKAPWYVGHTCSVNRYGGWLCMCAVYIMYLRILQDTGYVAGISQSVYRLGYALYKWGIVVRFPIVSKRLFSSPKRQDRLPVQCVQGVKGPGREDDHATVVRS